MIWMILLFLNMLFLFNAIDRLGRLKLAKTTLENIDRMYRSGIISEIQAKVYMNEMEDPFNSRAIMAVNIELKEIYEKHQNSNR